MKINCFEDLPVWQESLKLTKEIYLLTSKGKFSKDFYLKDQIRRAKANEKKDTLLINNILIF